jgi:hypothetical protein
MIEPTLREIRRLNDEILAVLDPLEHWAHQCHAASSTLVQSGVLGAFARVARGSCRGVGGQHSWVVVGDPYDLQAPIVDPTLWSYDSSVVGVWYGRGASGRHLPHGSGSIWEWGRPEAAGGEIVSLTPARPFSAEARSFLELLGPLDLRGWIQLAHAPVEGWPAAEIIDAICNTRDPRVGPEQKTNTTLASYVPIDIIGMLTDRNPGGAYLPISG